MKLSRALSSGVAAWLLLAAVAAWPAPPQRLVVWMVGDDKIPVVMAPAIEVFRARHPEVQVELRDVPWADAMTKYSAAFASRSGPDLITGGTTFGIEFGSKGGLLELNRHAPDLVQRLEAHAHPGVLRSVRRSDGALFAAPFDMHLQLQLWRTDMMAAAPATWAAFDATVAKLRAEGRRGFAQQWGNTGWMGFYPYLAQSGGAIYDAGCTKSVVDSPAAVRALRYYATLYTRLQAPTDTWPDADGGLEAGDYPLIQSGTWLLSSMDIHRRRARGKWAAAPLPVSPEGRRTAFLGSSVLAVTSFSPRAALALDFMRVVYEGEVARRMMIEAYRMGQMWLPSGRVDQLGALPMPADRKQALLTQLQDAEGPPNCRGWQRNDYVLTRAVQRVVLSGADAQAELGRAARTLTAALGRER